MRPHERLTDLFRDRSRVQTNMSGPQGPESPDGALPSIDKLAETIQRLKELDLNNIIAVAMNGGVIAAGRIIQASTQELQLSAAEARGKKENQQVIDALLTLYSAQEAERFLNELHENIDKMREIRDEIRVLRARHEKLTHGLHLKEDGSVDIRAVYDEHEGAGANAFYETESEIEKAVIDKGYLEAKRLQDIRENAERMTVLSEQSADILSEYRDFDGNQFDPESRLELQKELEELQRLAKEIEEMNSPSYSQTSPSARADQDQGPDNSQPGTSLAENFQKVAEDRKESGPEALTEGPDTKPRPPSQDLKIDL